MNCLRCEGPLEPGFIRTEGQHGPTAWVRGEAEYGALGGVRWRGKETFTIAASRCANCGRLELSANEELL